MKARIMGRSVEIPEGRVMLGVDAGHTTGNGSRRDPAQQNTTSQRRELAASPFIFTLHQQIPSGKNQVRTAWSPDKKRPGKMKPHKYPDKRFEAWRRAALQQIAPCASPLVGPVTMIVDYVPGDLIRRDLDGMLSALFHLAVKAGILLDDAQVKNLQWHQFPLDRKAPKCRVMLTRWEGE